MKCLVESKNRLNTDCRIGVEHIQINELEDVKFSYNFMKACRYDIHDHCRDILTTAQDSRRPVKKNEVIECLSAKHLEDFFSQHPSPLTEDCSAQLALENLQRHDDSMKFIPELRRACQVEYKRYCRTSKVRGLECLRLHHDEISPECRKQLFSIQREEAINPSLDVVLMRICKGSIMQLCDRRADPLMILNCLIQNKRKLDLRCRKVVKEREREQLSNIILNHQLLIACQIDLVTHCKDVLRNAEKHYFTGEEIHGQAIFCLTKFESNLEEKNRLSESCAIHVRLVMKEEAEDYTLDPMLTLHCVDSIQKFCPPESTKDIVQCLKVTYIQGHLENDANCMVIVMALLEKGRYYIKADPYLHGACDADIQRYCEGIEEGHGFGMTCVLNLVSAGHASQSCAEAVSQRKQMWKYAASLGHMTADYTPSTGTYGYILAVAILVFIGILIFAVRKQISRSKGHYRYTRLPGNFMEVEQTLG